MQTQNEKLLAWAQIIASLAAIGSLVVAYDMLKLSIEDGKERREESAARRAFDERFLAAAEAPYMAFEMKDNFIFLEFDETVPAVVQPLRKADQSSQVPRLRNYGFGSAFNCSVTYQITHLNDELLPNGDGCYHEVKQTNLTAGMHTVFSELPCCIAKDKAKAIKKLKGHLYVHYSNVNGKRESTLQQFTILTAYEAKEPYLYIMIEGPQRLGNSFFMSP